MQHFDSLDAPIKQEFDLIKSGLEGVAAKMVSLSIARSV
jgi:hypothetical protein